MLGHGVPCKIYQDAVAYRGVMLQRDLSSAATELLQSTSEYEEGGKKSWEFPVVRLELNGARATRAVNVLILAISRPLLRV